MLKRRVQLNRERIFHRCERASIVNHFCIIVLPHCSAWLG